MPKEMGSIRGVLIVVFFQGCGGLRTGSQVLQYQRGSALACFLVIFTQERWKDQLHCKH